MSESQTTDFRESAKRNWHCRNGAAAGGGGGRGGGGCVLIQGLN